MKSDSKAATTSPLTCGAVNSIPFFYAPAHGLTIPKLYAVNNWLYIYWLHTVTCGYIVLNYHLSDIAYINYKSVLLVNVF